MLFLTTELHAWLWKSNIRHMWWWERKMQGVSCQTLFKQKCTLLWVLWKISCLVTIFLSSCCFCLFLSTHCLFNSLESLLQETCYHFWLSKYLILYIVEIHIVINVMSNENWHIELFQITFMYNNAVREYLGMHWNCGVRVHYQKAIEILSVRNSPHLGQDIWKTKPLSHLSRHLNRPVSKTQQLLGWQKVRVSSC